MVRNTKKKSVEKIALKQQYKIVFWINNTWVFLFAHFLISECIVKLKFTRRICPINPFAHCRWCHDSLKDIRCFGENFGFKDGIRQVFHNDCNDSCIHLPHISDSKSEADSQFASQNMFCWIFTANHWNPQNLSMMSNRTEIDNLACFS